MVATLERQINLETIIHAYPKAVLHWLNTIAGASCVGAIACGLVFGLNPDKTLLRSFSAVMGATFSVTGRIALGKGVAAEDEVTAREKADRHVLASRSAHWYHRQAQRYQLPQAPAQALSGDLVDVISEDVGGQVDLNLFDWKQFAEKRNEFPHIGIAGKTGGGKSLLAEYLASCFDGIVVAVSPHWEKGDFTSADLVVAWGRNYGAVNDCRLSFSDALSGKHNISACGFLSLLHKEMDRRFKLDENQQFTGKDDPEIIVILDEFNAFASSKGLPEITKQLLREARKVKIRLIPLVHGTEVKALGCEGEGQIREQLTWIRVANKAKDYANLGLNKAKKGTQDFDYWQSVSQFIFGVKYPAFVEDCPANIPDLKQWKQQQPSQANLAGWEPSQGKKIVQSNHSEPPTQNPLNRLLNLGHSHIEPVEQVAEEWDGAGDIPASYTAALVQGIRQRLSKNQIITEVLATPKGGSKKYKALSEYHDALRNIVL